MKKKATLLSPKARRQLVALEQQLRQQVRLGELSDLEAAKKLAQAVQRRVEKAP